MIGSAVKSSMGKKMLSIFVALAMVLTMSNISANYANAEENASNQADAVEKDTSSEEVKAEESKDVVESEKDEATNLPKEEEKADDAVKTEDPVDEGDKDDDANASDSKTQNGSANSENSQKPSTPAVDPVANEPVSEPKAEDEPVDKEGEHSIRVTLNLYADGTLVDTVKSEPVVEPDWKKASFDLKSFIEAQQFAIPDYAYESATPKGSAKLLDEITLAPGAKSKNWEYDLSFFKDVLKDEYSSSASPWGDGIPDRYQSTLVFNVENGSWEDGTKDPIHKVITFFKDGQLSNASDAYSVDAVRYPLPGEPDQYYAKEGSWDYTVNYFPYSKYGQGGEFNYRFFESTDAKDSHYVSMKINYWLDNEFQYTAPLKASQYGLMNKELTLIPKNYINERNEIAQAIWFETQASDENGASVDITKPIVLKPYEASRDAGEINVFYKSDRIGVDNPNKGDGIADECQVTLNFEVNYGYLNYEQDSVQVFTLMKNGKPDKDGSVSVVAPTHSPYPGYAKAVTEDDRLWSAENGYGFGWASGAFPKGRQTITKKDDGKYFIYNYIPALLEYHVMHFDYETMLPVIDPETKHARFLDEIISSNERKYDIDGYVFAQDNEPSITIGSNQSENVVVIYYDKDANKDNVADKYQVNVTYAAVNGTVNGATSETVTLYDANGNFAVNGTGKLSNIPTFTPDEGFGKGTWSAAGKPTANTIITKNTDFVITYKELPSKPKPSDGNDGGNRNGDDGDDVQGNTNPRGTVDVPRYIAPVVESTAPNADDAIENEDPVEENDEGTIEDEENPLTAPDQTTASAQTNIADEENALAEFEEEPAQQDWLPFAIGAGIVLAGLILFLIARRKKNESETR